MSDKRNLKSYADFTHEVFRHLANQIHGHIHVILEWGLYFMYRRRRFCSLVYTNLNESVFL